MAPTVIRMPGGAGRNNLDNSGIKICCCRVFTCINMNILSSNHGLLKVSEVILGSCCQTMLVRFGIPNAEDIGQAFNSCLTTVAACLLTSTLLLFCYVVSNKSFHLVRQSLFVSKFLAIISRQTDIIELNDCFLGNFVQFVCLFHVHELIGLHGIHSDILVVPEIRIAASLYGLSGDDCGLRKYSKSSLFDFTIDSIDFILLQYIGFLLGIIYAIDAYSAYKFYKGSR